MHLQEITRVKYLDAATFQKDFLKPQRPVIVEEFIKDWPAYSKWSLDYIKEIAGEKEVPLYDDRPVDYRDGFNEPHARMKMKDYIDLLRAEPTKFRIFLWNVLREVPSLQRDFKYPKLGMRFLKGLPMLFFGGSNSHTFMHYDIDLANIFHFHFEGTKECILFAPSESRNLYKIPHSLITHESIDFSNPDFTQWPGLRYANGYRGRLEHGEMVYIPEGYWHHMKYITPGFSMSLRSIARKPKHLLKAVHNIVIMRHYDAFMRKRRGQEWIDWKNEEAIRRTHKRLIKK